MAGQGRGTLPTVLVTGAGGFIGAALCRDLLARGYGVIAASRQPGVAAAARHFPISSLDEHTDWSGALAGADLVVHLAARAHVLDDHAADAATLYRRANWLATLALARQAAAAGSRRLVFISSVKVNGEGRDRPYTEADAPAPEDDYGRSKTEAETGLASTSAAAGLETVILRLPLVYGPGVRANFLRLLRLADRGWPLPLGSIRNRRSLLYLGNVTDAIVAALEQKAAAHRTFLLSDGEDLSTPQLLAGLAEALGRPSRLPPLPVPLLDVAARALGRQAEMRRLTGSLAVDSSAFRAAANWRPPFTVAEGLAATARWYRQAH